MTRSVSPRQYQVTTNAVYLATSNIATVIVGFLVSILVARRFGLTQFGYFVTVVAFHNVAQMLGALGLPALITREVSQDRSRGAGHLLAGVAAASVGGICMSGLALLVTVGLDKSPEIQQGLLFVSAAIVAGALCSVAESVSNATNNSRNVMFARMVEAVIKAAGVLLVLARGQGVAGVFLVFSAAKLGALLAYSAQLWTQELGPRQWNWTTLAALIREMPVFWSTTALFTLRGNLIVILLETWGGADAAGLFGAAQRVLAPIRLLNTSYIMAAFPSICAAFAADPGSTRRKLRRVIQVILFMSVPVALVAALSPGFILHFVYGGRFAGAQSVLRVLAGFVLISGLTQLLGKTLVAIHRQVTNLLLNVLSLLALVVLLAIFARGYGAAGGGLAMLLAGLVMLTGQVWASPGFMLRLRDLAPDWRTLAAAGGVVLLAVMMGSDHLPFFLGAAAIYLALGYALQPATVRQRVGVEIRRIYSRPER